MNIDIGEIILFIIVILYFFLDKYLIPLKVNKELEIELLEKLEKAKSEFLKGLEDIKSLHQKEHFIHKLQFEKEFKIYSELWAELIKFKNVASNLLRTPQSGKQDMSAEEKLEDTKALLKTYEALALQFIKVHRMITDNKPFYSKGVYQDAKKLLESPVKEFFDSGVRVENIIADDESVNEKVSEMNTTIDSIEESMRNRIGIMGEAKLVE